MPVSSYRSNLLIQDGRTALECGMALDHQNVGIVEMGDADWRFRSAASEVGAPCSGAPRLHLHASVGVCRDRSPSLSWSSGGISRWSRARMTRPKTAAKVTDTTSHVPISQKTQFTYRTPDPCGPFITDD